MIKISISDARRDFASVIESVRDGERFVLVNHDRSVAAIVSVEDLALLEAHEDRVDLEAAKAALAEIAADGAIPWEDAKKELGID